MNASEIKEAIWDLEKQVENLYEERSRIHAKMFNVTSALSNIRYTISYESLNVKDRSDLSEEQKERLLYFFNSLILEIDEALK